MTVFCIDVKVRFAHCDPAGIIFYPRYFEILNGVVEDWFDQALGCSFLQLRTRYGLGTPMVDVRTEFLKPCRLDDQVKMTLELESIGRSSTVIRVDATIGDTLHIQSRGVLVCSKCDISGSETWPVAISEKMQDFLSL